MSAVKVPAVGGAEVQRVPDTEELFSFCCDPRRSHCTSANANVAIGRQLDKRICGVERLQLDLLLVDATTLV